MQDTSQCLFSLGVGERLILGQPGMVPPFPAIFIIIVIK